MRARVPWTPERGSPLEQMLAQALEWGVVGEGDLLAGDLRLSSVSHRNLNVRIERRLAPSLLIKRHDLAVDGAETVAAEARFYRHCARRPEAAEIAAVMPPLVGTFDDDQTLVVELVHGATSLWQELRRHGPPALSPEPLWELGRILGVLHGTFADDGPGTRPPGLRRGAPPYFGFHRPHPELLRTASPARLDLCRELQSEPAAGQAIDRLSVAWRSETVIHGDIRSENLLVVRPAHGPGRLLVVDWELVQLGDAAWDLAGAFEDLVRFWISGMAPRPDLDLIDRVATAEWPLAAVRSGIAVLCDGYRAGRGVGASELEPLLARAAGLSAIRMLQTAWEHSRHLESLSTLAVMLLQLAVNLLRDPERHGADLYGLGRGGAT